MKSRDLARHNHPLRFSAAFCQAREVCGRHPSWSPGQHHQTQLTSTSRFCPPRALPFPNPRWMSGVLAGGIPLTFLPGRYTFADCLGGRLLQLYPLVCYLLSGDLVDEDTNPPSTPDPSCVNTRSAVPSSNLQTHCHACTTLSGPPLEHSCVSRTTSTCEPHPTPFLRSPVHLALSTAFPRPHDTLAPSVVVEATRGHGDYLCDASMAISRAATVASFQRRPPPPLRAGTRINIMVTRGVTVHLLGFAIRSSSPRYGNFAFNR